MIVAIDVRYDDTRLRGAAAAVVFARWIDATPIAEYTTIVTDIQPYVSGEFFRRELPCLLQIISKVQESIDLIVVDGYVCLNDKAGLGQHLFEYLMRSIPVIGVAKSRFHNAVAVEILRGSKSPLFVTAIGTDLQEAADHVQRMHGQHRIPTLLKRVDQLAKGKLATVMRSDAG